MAAVVPDKQDVPAATVQVRPPSLERPERWTRPSKVGVVILLVGAVVAGATSRIAWVANRNNEHRLLTVQTVQAASLISASVLSIQNPLSTALAIETATGGSADKFSAFMASYVGPGKLFTSASVWRTAGGSATAVTSVGSAGLVAPTSQAAAALVVRASTSPTMVVSGMPSGRLQAVAYALADPASRPYAVFAERAIPANRRVPVESNSAFADLHFATYLGSTVRDSELATTDRAADQLPLRGDTSTVTVPFGDTHLTLVTSPQRQLGGTLGAELPWIFLVGGLGLSLAAAGVAERLARRRRNAERDAGTISELYGDLGRLYGEQRTIAETLQNALLPRSNPILSGVEVASRHVAGAEGVDVGGDWYSVVQVDERRFAFVVGDVSGRGVEAATIMAQLRYTLRAYLLEGHSPSVCLSMCATQLDVAVDGHFATVLVGVGDTVSREVTLANAGHLSPLLISGGQPTFVTVPVGPPIGVEHSSYPSTSFVVPPGATLLAFTDGLVERRGEDLGVGLERLAVEASVRDVTLDELLSRVLAALVAGGGDDDIAMLALRWA